MRSPMGANGQSVSSRSRVMARTGKLTGPFYDAGPGRAAGPRDARFWGNSRAWRPFPPFAPGLVLALPLPFAFDAKDPDRPAEFRRPVGRRTWMCGALRVCRLSEVRWDL